MASDAGGRRDGNGDRLRSRIDASAKGGRDHGSHEDFPGTAVTIEVNTADESTYALADEIASDQIF